MGWEEYVRSWTDNQREVQGGYETEEVDHGERPPLRTKEVFEVRDGPL